MIDKMAKVFKINKATNHFLCLFWDAFHKAKPFQGKTQSKIRNKNGKDNKFSSIEVNMCSAMSYFSFSQGPRGQTDI